MKLASLRHPPAALSIPASDRYDEPAVSWPDDEMPQAMTVFVRDLAVSTVIGVHDHERTGPQTILMDLDIELATSRAAHSDRLDDTIDYAAVADDLRACLAGKSYFLLERLAGFVADRILAQFGAVRVRVKVAKPAILKDTGHVGVTIERHRPAHLAFVGARR